MSNQLHTNEHFEQLLQNSADKYRMYPSDKVWDNIRTELHGKPKWPALIFIFTAIVLALTVATIYNYPPQKFLVKNNASIVTDKQQIKVVVSSKNNINTSNQFVEKLEPITTSAFTALANISQPSNDVKQDKVIETGTTNIVMANVAAAQNLSETVVINAKNIANNLEEPNNEKVEANNEQLNSNDDAIKPLQQVATTLENDNQLKKSEDVNNYLNTFKNSSIVKQPKKSKWQVQYYATISNSYRTLEDDKSRLVYLNNPVERQALKDNVNDVVRHKPAVGGEFGVSFLCGLTKNFHIKSGVQFNIRQYGIDAYRSDGNATFSYIENNQLNSFYVKSAYSTQAGTSKVKLENQLYQISIPMGLQWDVVNGERWGISAAATIQPTVTLNKSVYVVSTDYKYYADGTSFFRRFNINTSTELYFTLKSKNTKWFFGPQIRYQQRPTYNDIYPIKEYRVDYGIKFGFVKSL